MVYLEQIMDLLHDLAETQKDDTHTNLTKCLLDYKFPDSDLFERAAAAAHATEELEWMQGRYREAIGVATKDLQHVAAACLSLCLAELYIIYGDEPDKAVRIWERIGTEGSGSAALETDIAWTRQWALNQLGLYWLRSALADQVKTDLFIPKMERIVSRGRQGAQLNVRNKIPPSDMAKYLAFWYRKHGRMDEARQLVRPHIKDAILMLSDDDPSNDSEAFYDVSRVFLALGDAENFLAMMYVNRFYDDAGIVVIDGDKKSQAHLEDGEDTGVDEQDAAGRENDATSESGDEEDQECPGSCDGPCKEDFDDWDGVTCCLICGDFCERRGCQKKLMAGEVPGKSCNDSHGYVYIPTLTAKFKKGETVLGEKVVTLEEWKAGLKREWGL